MYSWFWRRLPGGAAARLVQLVMIAIVVSVVLWYLVYPWVALHLPIDLTGLG
ncbi:MAG: hypothetical protein J2P28_13730 [Actinobacteria bacterium]|nr:hypothetical protein [Actinomycetota bacterium]